ncbi:hypothetical protein [Methanobacterium formicicum]|uniref:Uncharacterized protein n=1 Tax=Methanobacterium formicicum TaxID=2162 RepID=A0A843AQW2_METFO|nr:hypothetical protein [Methanobacterium formicicum]MBF4475931.1 hypothetical protein [Methanobacterium formicicum]
MDNKGICLDLVNADSEQEVISILDNLGFWEDPKYWRYYGDKENNFSTIGNQQSSADTALVEKLVNSVDAVLMRECLRSGIDPESLDGPQSVESAAEDFFGIKNGRLANLNAMSRTKIAENICLVATGSTKRPCYSIIDKGEGQSPLKLPETFLSLNDSNKLRIPFVQGKFNMGSTGSLQFCGENNLQLLISKRDPQIGDIDNENLWGFTVIRKEPPKGNMKSSTFKYLVNDENNILSFESKNLPLFPGKHPEAYVKPMEWGTFIKLYDYDIQSYKSNINFDLNYRLSLLLPSLTLPIRLFERRLGYKGHSFESTISGLTVRLEEDKRKNMEKNFPSSDIISIKGQEMKVQLYAFKKDANVKNYKKNEGIIFTINGQSHGYIPTSFFRRKSVGMTYLRDSIFIIVDCTDFDRATTEKLFMNSRDRLRNNDIKKEIESELENLVKNHRGLKELREKRRREEIGEKLEDSKPLKNMIEDIIRKTPTLNSLFVTGNRINNPFNLEDTGNIREYEGKEYPTYFKLTKEFNEDKPKHCPINHKFRLKFETDALNDYFSRDTYPGSFEIKCFGQKIDGHRLNLWNGIATLTCPLPENTDVGDIIKYEVKVFDELNMDPFINEFNILADKEANKTKGKPGKRVSPPGGKGKNRQTSQMLAMPEVQEINKEKWESHQFNKESGLSVLDNGEGGYDFFINMDNLYLLAELKNKPEPDILKSQYKFGMVLIGLGLLNSFEKEEDKDIDIDKQIRKVSQAIAPMLLPMINNLGKLQAE